MSELEKYPESFVLHVILSFQRLKLSERCRKCDSLAKKLLLLILKGHKVESNKENSKDMHNKVS